jgi:protein-tyrosine kinase
MTTNKIEKALERAKKKKPKEMEDNVHEASRETPSYLDVQESVYTHTEVVQADQHHLEKNKLLALTDDPIAVDCYNLLRTQILEKTRRQGHNAIMITSGLAGEGKTVTAINLAASIAKEMKQRVLLVDADLRNPRIHKYLGCSRGKGLSDYLKGEASVTEILLNPGFANMVVLPGGQPLSDSTDVLGSSKMEKMVEEMKHRYPDRYIIFDCPPVLLVPDALVFSSYVDGVVLVVEAGRTTTKQIRKTIALFEDRNVVGLVMNKGEAVSKTPYYY